MHYVTHGWKIIKDGESHELIISKRIHFHHLNATLNRKAKNPKIYPKTVEIHFSTEMSDNVEH